MSQLFLAPTWPVPIFDQGYSYTPARVYANAPFSDYNWPGTLLMPYISVTTVVGQTYQYVMGDSDTLTTGRTFVPIPGGGYTPGGAAIPEGVFVATQTTYWLWSYPGHATVGSPIQARVLLVG